MKQVLLVGAGHAHIEILRRWAVQALPAAELTVMVDRDRSVYSGMVPGFVAGQYQKHELEIDVGALVCRAGARLLLAAATRVDAAQRVVHGSGCEPVQYDVASLDVGSTVAGADLPGVAEHAIATRPIHRLVSRMEQALEPREAGPRAARIVIVGSGAGGVELAFCCAATTRGRGGPAAKVVLLDSQRVVLAGAAAALSRRVERAAERRGIEWQGNQRVVRVRPEGLELASGRLLESDLVLWAAGAGAHPFLEQSGLPVDAAGFVRVTESWQVEGYPTLFAVGDCASRSDNPALPKAGVHAVRAGPVLWRNLGRVLAGRPPKAQRPQTDFLSLLNLGDGSAIGSKWGLSVEGRVVMRLKDRIDRRFMRRYE